MRLSALLVLVSVSICLGRGQINPLHRVGKVHISSSPGECSVTLDNRPCGTTPVLLESVLEGIHVVALRKSGFCTRVDTFEVSSGDSIGRSLTLSPECELTARSTPGDAAIFLNGAFYGRTPMHIGQLPPGDYAVMLTRRDYERWMDTVHLMVGSPVRLNAELKVRPAQISVLAPDSTVEVIVNHRSLGFGSRRNLPVASGYVTIEGSRVEAERKAEGTFYIAQAAIETYRIAFNNPTRQAFWYSLVYPGAGQFATGSRAEGIAIGLAFLGSVAATIITYNEYTQTNSDYTSALETYDRAVNTSDVLAARHSVETAYDASRTAAQRSNICFGIAAGVYVFSLIDAWFFHDTVDEVLSIGRGSAEVTAAHPGVAPAKVALTLKVSLR